MKQIYTILFTVLMASVVTAQVVIPYPQQVTNYDSFFTDGGGNFDSGTTEFGMWANAGGTAKQSVAWRNFTEDGTTGGNAYTLGVGDSFTITVSATQASFGEIGISLLSSPSATATWADRKNNYAVQVNLNGNGGANDPWEVVSTGGVVNASSIGGSTSYADFKFLFTLSTATTMNVSINDGAEAFDITLNNTNITAYSVYFADDWNGTANENIYWKPTSELSSIILSTDDFLDSSINIFAFENKINIKGLTSNQNYNLSIFDTMGRQVKNINSNADIVDISELHTAVYFLVLETAEGNTIRKKIIRR